MDKIKSENQNTTENISTENILSENILSENILLDCNKTTKNPNNNISLIDSYWYKPDIKNKLHMINLLWCTQEIKQVIGRAVRIHNTSPEPEDKRVVETIVYKSDSNTNNTN
jgi:hypothetical protein